MNLRKLWGIAILCLALAPPISILSSLAFADPPPPSPPPDPPPPPYVSCS